MRELEPTPWSQELDWVNTHVAFYVKHGISVASVDVLKHAADVMGHVDHEVRLLRREVAWLRESGPRKRACPCQSPDCPEHDYA